LLPLDASRTLISQKPVWGQLGFRVGDATIEISIAGNVAFSLQYFEMAGNDLILSLLPLSSGISILP
jgi:hypothetical protein